jgi:oligopeptide/dipeptide ABC transporter ATP-binding protein
VKTSPAKDQIAIDKLSVDFITPAGVAHVVRDVSVQARAGSIVGLVGESGSGKSTVGLALLGLLAANARVTSGRLSLGVEPFDLTRGEATAKLRGTRVAMIFQDPLSSLNPVFSVRSHLFEILRRVQSHSGRHWSGVATEALAAVGIDHPRQRLDQYPHELSGGMRQRVAIAMALLARPQLLIADEPTTALDVTIEAQVMAELRKLRDTIGCTILFITHSLGLVAQHCDSIAVLYAGELVEQGSVATVARAPGHPYTSALLACEVTIDQPRGANAADNRFKVVRGELPDPRQRPEGCIFRNRCEFAFEPCATIIPPAYAGSNDSGHVARCHLRAGP